MQALPLHQMRTKGARHETHLWQLLLQGSQLGRQLPRIGHGDMRAAAHAPARHGHARGAQAEDQDVLVLQRRHACAWATGRLGRGLSGVGRRFATVLRSHWQHGGRGLWRGHFGKDLRHKIGRSLGGRNGRGLVQAPGAATANSTCCDARGLVCDRTQLTSACGWRKRGAGRTRLCLQRRGHGVGRKNGVVVAHRSFRVDRPTRHSSMVMIQKRTTTCVSFHPLFSKWWCRGAIFSRRRPSP